MISRKIILQYIVLSQHVLYSLFPLLNFYSFLRSCGFAHLFVYYKAIVRHFTLNIASFWLFWYRILFLQTSMLGVTHISIWWCFWVCSHNDIFRFGLFTLFDVRSLYRKVSAFFTFSFVLFTSSIYLSDDIFIHI